MSAARQRSRIICATDRNLGSFSWTSWGEKRIQYSKHQLISALEMRSQGLFLIRLRSRGTIVLGLFLIRPLPLIPITIHTLLDMPSSTMCFQAISLRQCIPRKASLGTLSCYTLSCSVFGTICVTPVKMKHGQNMYKWSNHGSGVSSLWLWAML